MGYGEFIATDDAVGYLWCWWDEMALFRESLLNGEITLSEFFEIYRCYEWSLYDGVCFPVATLTGSMPKTAKAQNRQLKRVALYA